MLREQEALRIAAGFAELGARHGAAFGEIGPAVPAATIDLPQRVGDAEHRAAAAHVERVVGHVDLIAIERESERIAKAPGDELDGPTARTHAHHGTVARHLAFDHLAALAGGAHRVI